MGLSVSDNGAKSGLAAGDSEHGIGGMKIKDDNRNVVVAAQGKGRGIHHVEALGEGFLAGERLIARRGEIELRVGRVDAVDLGGLEEGVGIDLGGTERRTRIGREKRIAGAAGENHDRPLREKFAGATGVKGGGNLRHLLGSHHDGSRADTLKRVLDGQGVDNRGQHAHRVTENAVRALLGTRQAAEDIASAEHDADFDPHGHEAGETIGDIGQNSVVMTGRGGPLQDLAAELQKNSLVLRLHRLSSHLGCLSLL